MQTQTRKGPGQRVWHPISEYEVGRPRLRPRKNPVPANYGNAPMFPFSGQGVGVDGQAVMLQMLAWQLRDSYVVLASQTWNVVSTLFTTGTGGNLFEFGATSNQGPAKPKLLANVNSNSGLLPSPQSFLATHITQIVRPDVYVSDLLNLLYSTYYRFYAGDQDWTYLEGYGSRVPSAQNQIKVGYIGSTYTGTVLGVGWDTVHNAVSLRSGLMDPSLGIDASGRPVSEDMGYNIAQNKQFKFDLDPTQFSFIANTVAQGSWATKATASGGTGIQGSIVLEGVLARSQAG